MSEFAILSKVCEFLLDFLVLNNKRLRANFLLIYVLIRMKFTLNEKNFDI